MITTALNYEEKVQLLTHLGKIYRKGNLCKDFSFHGIIMESSGSYADIELASQIQIILSHMNPAHTEIIRNDFLDLQEANWYQNQYDDELYLQLKSDAMTQFLDCLYA